jgi:AbrB family looped-hinge helix DNA binding protein
MTDMPPAKRAKITGTAAAADVQVTGARGKKAMKTAVRRKGVVTIPQQVREALQLEEGDDLIVAVEDGRIVLTPAALVPRDQEWFWSPEWQGKEAEADADLAAGRVARYDTDEEFLNALATD